METKANLTLEKIRYDQDNEAHLVLSLTAPSTEGTQRPRLCLLPLLDISPSMAGSKLAYAQRSLLKLIDHLAPTDYCGLVVFAGHARTLEKPLLCTPEGKDTLRRHVNGVRLEGSTNISDALLEGLKVINDMDLPGEIISRVILFTDGGANCGIATQPAAIVALAKANLGVASVSSFGYGADVQHDMLLDLAKTGSGNYAYIENPDDALSAFGKELGGLLSTHATNITIEVQPLAGHSVTQVVSDVDAEEEDMGDVGISFPDIISGETRHIVLKVKLQAQKQAFPRSVNTFEVKVGYDVLDANLRKERKVAELKVKAQFVKAGEEQIKQDPELDRIVGLAQLVRAQLEADTAAKRGEYLVASSIMSGVSSDLHSRGLSNLSVVANNLSGSVNSQDAYIGSASYRTSVTRGATRGVGGTYVTAASLDLSLLGVEQSSSMQTEFARSFQDAPVETTTTEDQAKVTGMIDWLNPVQVLPLGNTTAGSVSGVSTYISPSVAGVTEATLTNGTPGVTPPESTPKKTSRKSIKQKAKRW